MIGAAKKESVCLPGLAALRLVLLLVVALCLPETRVWGFATTPQPASDVFESASPSSIGENTIAWQYDASGSPVAAKGATQLEFGFAKQMDQASGLVIGRGADLAKPGALAAGEYRLGWFSVQKTSGMGAEWAVNEAKLLNVMKLNKPIRDGSSLLDTGGFYLNRERGLLQSSGWSFQSGHWMPPTP